MNAYEQEVKAVYEGFAGKSLTDAEVADIALTLRQFAAFLIDCAMDAELMERLGLKRAGEGSVGTRVANNTTRSTGDPLREPLPAKTNPPTGAPLRDFTHHESSASPVVLTATTSDSPVEVSVPGRQS
jgi:hypothetical protein